MEDIIETIEKIGQAENVTENLVNRTHKVAVFIRNTMKQLAVSSLMSNKYKYIVDSCGQYADVDGLTMLVDPGCEYYDTIRVCIDVDTLSAHNEEVALWPSEYGSPTYRRPSRENILEFVDDMPELLRELAAMSEVVDVPEIA